MKVPLDTFRAEGEPEFHRGSCVCHDYELRITERCLVEDLQVPANTCFRDALSHPIVRAFLAKRQQVPTSAKTVGPYRGARTLYHLGVGNDHRGATWHDAANTVVWLCGYGLHRSGQSGDAFRRFKLMLEQHRMHPVGADFRRLVYDRQFRFLETAQGHATALRRAATSHPGIVQEGVLGHRVPVRLVLYVSPGIVDITIAFQTQDLNHRYLNHQDILSIVGFFAPDQAVTLKDPSDTLGGFPLLPGEIAYQIIAPT